MVFEEKGAWGSLLGLVLVSAWFFPKAAMIAASGDDAGALIRISVVWIVAMIVLAAAYHAIVAAFGDQRSDERDRLIELKAERVAGHALAFTVLLVAGSTMAGEAGFSRAAESPLQIAVGILFALAVGEAAKNIAQIIYYRAGA